MNAQAQAPASGTDVVAYFVQYGIPGLVIAALLLGLLWAKPAVDRLIKDKERAEHQRDALLEIYEEKLLPALTDSISVTRDLKPLLTDVVATLAAVREQMGRADRDRRPD